jgi:hypothetical protein
MTASFGVSTVLPGDTDESVLGRADKGLLIAKESGRDRVVGLGLEASTITKHTESGKAASTGGWFSWMLPCAPIQQEFELITNVPRDVTLEKLKGFVLEFKATVLQVSNDSVELEVDCRNVPIPQTQNERLGKFRMSLTIAELETKTPGRTKEIKICTLLELAIRPIRSRDRRNEVIQSQILRLKAALQGLMLANDVDDEMRSNIIRKIKQVKDSRY